MSNMSTISIRVDSDDKNKFEKFCSATGLNVSTAINMYIKSVLMNNEIPFKVKYEIPISDDVPNAVTMAAINEGDALIDDPNQKEFKNSKDLRKSLGKSR